MAALHQLRCKCFEEFTTCHSYQLLKCNNYQTAADS
jgi:hypothetical protein